MKYPKYAYISQCVFPNQRDNEKVFIITRRHYIEFIKYFVIFIFLIIIPIVMFLTAIITTPGILVSIGVLGRDFLVLFACSYYLLVITFFATSWVSYYYDMFIVTDTRIIEISQKGLFNRESYELLFEQIEDVTTRESGFLYTALEAGDVDIQTAGSQRNFEIYRIPKPYIVSEIIAAINNQAKKGIPSKDRMPKMAMVGIIDYYPVMSEKKIPPILNFDRALSQCRVDYNKTTKGGSLREKFDRWWWSHLKRDRELFTDYNNRHGGKDQSGGSGS